MANRSRNIQMKFWVTEDEKTLIEEKMKLLPTQRYGAYLRKMAIDGYIIYTDTADIKEMNKALGGIIGGFVLACRLVTAIVYIPLTCFRLIFGP